MATDFSYNEKTINSSGPIKPSGINQPLDPRTEVKLYADIKLIPNPYVGMIITVLEDETNSNKMTDYKVLSLKSDDLGVANSVVDRVQRYVEYLGVSTGGSSSSGTGLTSEQEEQLNKIPEMEASINSINESLNTKANTSDIPTNTSELYNDSGFLTSIPSEYVTETEMNEAIANISSGGSVSQEEINTAVNTFLIENPISGIISRALKDGEIISIDGSTEPSVISVTGIELNSAILSMNEGETKQLSYTIKPSNATNKTVTWRSSNNSVATVDNGLITCLKAGATDISVITEDGGYVSSCALTVNEVSTQVPLQSISINPSAVELFPNGTTQLEVVYNPTNATNRSINWSISPEGIATVSLDGLVEAVMEGECVVTATSIDGNKIATCNITVVAKESLTTVTRGLIHSYDFTDSSRISGTNVSDITGTKTITLENFNDLSTSLTSEGIKATGGIVNMGSIFDTSSNELTLSITMLSESTQKYNICSFNEECNLVLFNRGNGATEFLGVCSDNLGSLYNNRRNNLTITINFSSKTLSSYVNGALVADNIAITEGLAMPALTRFFMYQQNYPMYTLKNVLVYNVCLTASEVRTLSNEVNLDMFIISDMSSINLSNKEQLTEYYDFTTLSKDGSGQIISPYSTNILNDIDTDSIIDTNGLLTTNATFKYCNYFSDICTEFFVLSTSNNPITRRTEIINTQGHNLRISVNGALDFNSGIGDAGTLISSNNILVMKYDFVNKLYNIYLNGVKIISDKYRPADPNDRSSRNIHFKSNVILYKKLAIYDGELTDEQIIEISNELLRGDI